MKKVTREWLRDLVLQVTPETASRCASLDDDLYESGAVDSFSVIQIIQQLEEKLEIVFDYSDFSGYHFRNLQAMADLLNSKYLNG